MKRIIVFVYFFILIAGSLNSQPSQYADYFPLAVGNVYKYKHEVSFPCMPPSITYYKMRVVKDTIAFGKKYFLINSMPYQGWFRFDSTNGNLLQLFPGNGCSQYPNDKIYDSLASKLGNSCNGCLLGPTLYRQCIDTSDYTILGVTRKSKRFNRTGVYTKKPRYLKGLGMVKEESGEPDICNYITLLGCYVNGVLYGDTILTNILKVNLEIPIDYNLLQNFPNPFNPKTSIVFEIPKESYTELTVYDITGKEVQKLADEILMLGTYRAEFDGSACSSGVYFYVLKSGSYSETKRMVLLK